MAKLRVEDFKRDEDGWYRCGLHSISLYRLGGEYAATVHALEDGYGPHGAKIRSWQEVGGRPGGFRSRDEALQWGVDMLNGFPLQRACAALEVAFAAMSEWMPLVLPALANARAEAALAEREACAARLEESASTLARLAAEHLELSAMRVLYRHQSDVLLAESALLRDRTTPATLSTDTLAAIAEARGLCVLTAERVAELEAAAKSETHRTMCEWCGTPATCIVTSEGDPYALACDEHCGHSAEDAGGRAMLSEPGELLALVNALRDRAEDAEKHASAAVIAEREACAVRIKQAADQLDAAAARIGGLIAERDMAQTMIDELNGDLARVARERNEARADAAAARAEAALAEREACAARLEELLSAVQHELDECGPAAEVMYEHHDRRDALRSAVDAVRARTTPATLSTDTLAAIAEARGLCVVEPEHLAELQAAAKTLSEMPVLRWTRDGSKDTATVAGLTLLAGDLDWRVEVTKTGKLIDAGVIMADGIVAARFCAARCASEVLGVTLPAEVITARDGDGGVL